MDLPALLTVFAPIFTLNFSLWAYFSDYLLWSTITYISVSGLLAVLSWTAAYYILERLQNETIWPRGRAVLITGASSGFGHQLAIRLDEFGFHVYAGLRQPDSPEARQLRLRASERLKIVQLDVTSPEDVVRVVQKIQDSGLPLWAVVNNAGNFFNAFADWGGPDVQLYKDLFEVNVWGMIRLTKSCMPLLRETQGRVVNVGSLGGRATQPTMSHYCMTRHCVRVFSDALRRELYLTGDQIKVVTIEPTFYRTKMSSREVLEGHRERIFSQTPLIIQKAYRSPSLQKWMVQFHKAVDCIARPNIDEVIEAMTKAVTLEHPKTYYRCCSYVDVVFWGMGHLPEVVVDYLNRYLVPLLATVFEYTEMLWTGGNSGTN